MYPYQNLEYKNLRGERWKDIPGYVGYYQVFNLGRVRSYSLALTQRVLVILPRGSTMADGVGLNGSLQEPRNRDLTWSL
ncbi:MAG: hypothetical protein KGO82_05670 [Bacteroidota bacterium]|nr:hypothetical protein [Bacteroidota bacterium]